MSMNHEERNIIEILRRLEGAEKKLAIVSGASKTKTSSGSAVGTKDHRFLSNLNTEEHMHLTGEEYRSAVTNLNDHGSLTGLLDNDHPQYIRHSLAGYEWDMLVAETNPVSDSLRFARKSIDSVRNKIAERLFPLIDSTTAMTFYKSDGTTPIVIIDTLNERVGIGAQPATTFHVDGTTTIANGNLAFDSNNTVIISSDTDLVVDSADGIFLTSTDVGVVLSNGTDMRSETFAEDTYGWSVKNSGDAFFRNVKVNKINARIVSTGVEQYIGGRQTMCKSASPLTDNFTVPEPEATSVLHVEPFADYPYVHVFDDGDIIRLIHVSLYDGKYNTNDCWGTVVFSPIGARGKQVYTFTRSASPNSGSCKAGAVIPAGELVLNFGVSGDGYIVSTVV
jgi:hypothetical protein